MFVSMVILAFLSRQRKTPAYWPVFIRWCGSTPAFHFGEGGFFIASGAMKKTEEVLQQYEFAGRYQKDGTLYHTSPAPFGGTLGIIVRLPPAIVYSDSLRGAPPQRGGHRKNTHLAVGVLLTSSAGAPAFPARPGTGAGNWGSGRRRWGLRRFPPSGRR